jgi:23S rRNA (uracil1939-C5)-methyltransferase
LLEHVGRVNPEEILAPLTGPAWQYRHKARLGVKYVLKKESLLVGFREKRSSFIVEMEHCEILHSSVGRRINALKNLIMSLDAFDKIPQIEVAVADNKTALVFRHLVDLNEDDINRLVEFQSDTDISIYLQSGGPTTVKSLNNSSNDELYYELDEYGIKIRFEPNDFTQINFDINKKMINRVIEKLEPDADDHILDLFCGLGNFSLPLAKKVGHVTAVEGDQSLVDRGNNNAKMNAIENINFVKCDLMADVLPTEISQKNYNKVLFDPPRTGCKEIIEKLDFSNISRLVYVSCNPSTLARDAGVLVHEKGLNLIAAGVMDMFPHTSHVESLAIFEH